MEQKRCFLCDELYDARLRRCPHCFADDSAPEEEPPPPPAEKAPTPARGWRSPFDGEILSPSPRGVAIRGWTDRIALGIIAFCVGLEVFAVLGFVLGVPITRLTVAQSAIVAVAAIAVSVWRQPGRVWRTVAISAICALLLVGSSALAGRFFDVSFDGQAYQGSEVVRLAAGWNPLADVEGKTLVGPHTIWHAHYPKGPGFEAAAMFKALGRIEPAKGLTLFLACAAFAFCLGVFASIERVPIALAGVLALLAAFSPIVFVQIFTFYVDGRTGALLTILIVALLDMALRADADPLIATIVSLCAVGALNIKFTTTVFVLVLLLGGAAIIFARVSRRAFWRAALIIAVGVLVGLFVVGWDPYVTNTVDHQSPFYPLSGPNSIQILSPGTIPGDFATGSPLVHLYRSVFGVSADPFAPDRSEMKLPFTIRASEWQQFNVPDQRVGALGPLFGGALILALLTAIIVLAAGGWRSSPVMITMGMIGVVLVTVVLNPNSWNVRYNPQLWLVPLLIVLTAYLVPRNVAARVAALATCVVLFADLAFVATASTRAQLEGTHYVRGELTWIAKTKQPVPIYFDLMGDFDGERFKEAGISYRVLAEKPAGGVGLYNTDTFVSPQ